MHRIDTPTAQIDKFGPGKNGFTNGDPATGRRATDLNSDMWDAMQEEVANAIEGNGIALDKSKHNQLYLAIQKAITDPGFLKKANNLSDVADKAEARGNLGLGTAATKNVGTGNGNVMAVGAFGLGAGPVHQADAYGNIAEFFRITASSANRPGNNSYGGVRLPIDGGPTTSYVVVGADMTAWIGRSQLQANGVAWARVYTTLFKPTAADVNAVAKSGDTMTGQLIAPSVATTPGATPWGAGAFSAQLSTQAPFFQPNWQWPVTAGGIYAPIAKGVVTRQGQGYPTAVSFGYLLNGTPSFAIPCIHAKGDNIDVNWRFDPNTGQFYSPGNVIASGAIFHTDGNITGNIWGGYLSNWLNNQLTARDNNINTRATWDYVNSRSAISGGRNAWWYKDEVTGLIFQGGVVNRSDYATWVGFPRGYTRECFGVQMTLAWTNGSWFGDSRVNIQARDVGNGGFNAYMDGQEQSAFWCAVGV